MSRRYFTLVEGTSSKFWAITLEGASHAVEFGRIGTSGQSSRKEFSSEAEARASLEKLVAEKVRKGYVEKLEAEAAPTDPPIVEAAPRIKSKPKPKVETVEPEPILVEPTTPATPLEIRLNAERSIDLEPSDLFWATWQPFEPVTPPEPKPFDRNEALARLKKVIASEASYSRAWRHARLSEDRSLEASKFWLSAICEQNYSTNAARNLFEKIQARTPDLDKPPSFVELSQKLRGVGHFHSSDLAVPIFRYYSFDECLAVWIIPFDANDYGGFRTNQLIFEGFCRYIRATFDATQAEAIRDKLRPHLVAPKTPPGMSEPLLMPWYLAASMGMSDEVATLLRMLPDSQYSDKNPYATYYQSPQWLVLGLGDPAKIEAEWRRLKLPLRSPEQVRAWLATTGFHALDVVRDSIFEASKKEEAQAMVEALARAKGPEVAPVMLELMIDSKAPRLARQWLDDNPGHAIAGLIPIAGGKGKLADAALEFLREQKQKGQDAFLRQCLETTPGEVADRVRREVLDRVEIRVEPLDDASTPEPIRTAIAASSKLKSPTWVSPEVLPKILVGGRSLTEKQTSTLLAGLAKSTLAEPQAIVKAVRATADRASLDAFAWALFERWLRDGTPSKEKWAMLTIGWLGSDGSASKLTPLIRAWPGEGQHARAVTGLECLRAIGTDGAMMRLNGIAQKLPFKGLKAKAAEMMEAIAQDRQMTRAQLEDRIVPDCELDERGSRVFDFGPRQFTFVLGGEMKPMIRDPEGKLKTDLPKPGTKDDPVLANAAVEAWKLIKKQIKEVAKVQADRLEQAMVTGRRWTVEDFQTLLVQHPLMINLVRLVLWGGYDAAGKLVATFRVTEERDFADIDENSFKLDGLARVGIVHPLHLSNAESTGWGVIFGDYELIPPFPQLGRPVHRLEPGEEASNDLKGRVTGKIEAVTLVGILERLGWARGIPEDAGVFHEHSKAFEGANVTAVIEYPGVPVGYMVGWEDQNIQRCYFVPGIYSPTMYPHHTKSVPLKQVDPVVISEVLGTLGALASKAK